MKILIIKLIAMVNKCKKRKKNLLLKCMNQITIPQNINIKKYLHLLLLQYIINHFSLNTQIVRASLASLFPSLNFHHSSLITQFFIPIWHHHLIFITQYFSHYLWVHTCQPVQLFFLFSVPKLTEANI